MAIPSCWSTRRTRSGNPLREAQLRLHSRHCAGRGRHGACRSSWRCIVISRKSVPEFIDMPSASGPDTMASAGNGGPQHVAGELFKMMTGINMLHVRIGHNAAVTDLFAGRCRYVRRHATSIEHIRAGKLRPFAVTTVAPLAILPDIPTVASSCRLRGKADDRLWRASQHAPGIIDKLNAEINAGLAIPRSRSASPTGRQDLADRPRVGRLRRLVPVHPWLCAHRVTRAPPAMAQQLSSAPMCLDHFSCRDSPTYRVFRQNAKPARTRRAIPQGSCRPGGARRS